MVFHASRKVLVNPHKHIGGSVVVKRQDTDDARVDPSAPIIKGKQMVNDVSKMSVQYPLSSGVLNSTGSAHLSRPERSLSAFLPNGSHLGGALDVKFGKKEKEKKFKLKI